MYIKMTSISQRTILFGKATDAVAKKKEIQLHEMGKNLIKKKPSQFIEPVIQT